MVGNRITKRLLLAMMVFTLLLGAASFVQATPGQAAETLVPAYGAPAYLDGSPVGGGTGYSQIYSAADADYVVDTAAELKSALASATSGDIVYVDDGATIVLDRDSSMYSSKVGFNVPAGVILAGGRGDAGVTGGTIRLASGFHNSSEYYLIRIRDGSKVIGLHIDGPQDGTSGGNMWTAILAEGDDGEIANNEIHGLGLKAVLIDGCTGVWIHHNSMHHIRETQSNYAVTVCVSGGNFSSGVHASAVVEGNYFNYSCQTMAAARGLSSFIFRYNYIGPDATGQVVDCHGQNDDNGSYLDKASGGEYEWPAGEYIEVYSNTSLAKGYGFVRFRGIPTSYGFCSVHNNWTYETKTTIYSGSGGQFAPICQQLWYIPEYEYNTPRDSASESWGYHPWVRMEEYDNWWGTTPPPGVTPNSPPATPSTPSGPTSGQVGTAYTYQTVTTDPDSDQIRYTIDWGDGTTSTTDLLTSGVTASVSHTWTAAGEFWLDVQAADSHGAVSSKWSPGLRVTVVDSGQPVPTPNSPPATPATPSGPTSGQAGAAYTYQAMTTDPDEDAIQYTFDWGDGTTSTTELLDSGVTASVSHAWTIAGDYWLYVQATDSGGAVSSGSTYGLHVKVVSPFQTSSVISNSVPTSPVAPSGMTAGLTYTEYKYSAMTTDPDSDALIYLFFWGDGTFSVTAQVDSGVTAATTHAWSQPGTYAVYVKAADANGAVSAPSYALSVKVLSQVQAAATQESSRAVGTPSDSSSTGPSDAVDGDASGNPSHGSLDNQSSPLVPAHASGFVWCLFSVSVIMGAAVLLIGAIVRDTISEPPGW